MCGLCGVLNFNGQTQVDQEKLAAMTATLSQRGPDDVGYFCSGPVGLGHRRLSIIDLETGHQPLSNEDGSIWIVYNGELYNYREIRASLTKAGHRFATASDTEVIVHAYEEYGADCLKAMNGMFAFALWDSNRQRLLLARDRIGIKPLYYAKLPHCLLFGSEVKSLLAHPQCERRLSVTALNLYLSLEYVPTPHCIFAGVHKLPPGHYLLAEGADIHLERYWDLRLDKSEPAAARTVAECRDEVLKLLSEAVEMELIADVPVGVLLSGGIDSSAVAAMMTRASSRPVPSFCVAFDDPSFDESSHARLVARHLGTEHHEFPLSADTALATLPEIVAGLDEPLGDSSIIPTYCLSRFTKEHVKVALGGDGGDELFGGYSTLQAHRLATYYQRLIPGWLRDLVEPWVLEKLPVSFDNLSFDFKMRRFLRDYRFSPVVRHHRWLGSFTPEEKAGLLSPLAGGSRQEVMDLVEEYARRAHTLDPLNQVLYCDLKLYLEGDILVKVDRASMANSLEVRVPLLNRLLVEYAARLPHSFKLRGLTTKFLLRHSLKGILPDLILTRGKKGFNAPVAKWLAGPLKPLLEDLLSPARLKRQGLFQPGFVTNLITEHQARHRDHRKLLWTLLAFQMWYQHWIGQD
uniref:asparagine synthase (glutamine-hydrolyzing) n=1 Tax=Desulfobacca acetoxidans TaxID=60893 RepID=A0A7V6DR25_9BACT